MTLYDAQILARRIAERAYLNSETEIASWIMDFANQHQQVSEQSQRIHQLEGERKELVEALRKADVQIHGCIQVFNGSYELGKTRYEELLKLSEKIESLLSKFEVPNQS